MAGAADRLQEPGQIRQENGCSMQDLALAWSCIFIAMENIQLRAGVVWPREGSGASAVEDGRTLGYWCIMTSE